MADNLTPEQRRKTMQAVKGRNTSLEKLVAGALRERGLRCRRRNVGSLAGKPDFVFTRAKVAVFVDGDFWHGWRFSEWKDKLTDYWRKKIERNRHRDRCNFRRLRRQGWIVVRLWGHDVERDLAGAVQRVETLLRDRTPTARSRRLEKVPPGKRGGTPLDNLS